MYKKLFFANIAILLLASFLYERDLILALAFSAVILSPSLIVANYSLLISSKIITHIAYLSILNGLFFYYINYVYYDNYIHYSIYTLDYLKVIVPASLILIVFLIFLIIWENIYKSLYFKYSKSFLEKKKNFFFIPQYKKNIKYFPITIFIIVTLTIIFISFTRSMGLSASGAVIEPLPFKLIAIFNFTLKIIVPILLSALYVSTKRYSLLILLIIYVFVIYSSISLGSRSVIFSTLSLILYSDYIKKKFLQFFLTLIIVFFCFNMATLTREFLYITQNDLILVNKNFSFIEVFFSKFNYLDFTFYKTFFQILDRFISFRFLYLSSDIQLSNTLNGFGLFLHSLDWNLYNMPNNELHLIFLGYEVPRTFYNLGADLLTKLFWSMNISLFFLFLMLITFSFIFFLTEILIIKIKKKYNLKTIFSNYFIFGFVISIYLSPGYPMLKFYFLGLLFLNIFPMINLIYRTLLFLGISRVLK
jgi:hypothetical protein